MERRNLRRWLCTLVLMMAMFFLTACSPDCLWHGRGETWIDQNEDGVWDSDEPPLEGVEFTVRDTRRSLNYTYEEMFSTEDGSVDLSVFTPGCATIRLEVYVDTPIGYQLTTEPRVHVSEQGEVVRFGFVSVKDQNP